MADQRVEHVAMSELLAGYESAARAVVSAATAEEAFQLATHLLMAAESVVGAAATLRARMAQRIMNEDGMSLAQLAQRIGTSKSRADQLIRAANRDAGQKG